MLCKMVICPNKICSFFEHAGILRFVTFMPTNDDALRVQGGMRRQNTIMSIFNKFAKFELAKFQQESITGGNPLCGLGQTMYQSTFSIGGGTPVSGMVCASSAYAANQQVWNALTSQLGPYPNATVSSVAIRW